MPSERWGRTLLRLYPRAWRERYGDEFLALIDDSGLTWRAIVDVIASAGTERVRAVVALANDRVDPVYAMKFGVTLRARDALADFVTFAAMLAVVVLAFARLGVPYPLWTWWIMVLSQTNAGSLNFASMLATRCERLVAPVFWFGAALSLTAAGWLAGIALGNVGVPEPSTRTFDTVLGIYFVSGAFRLLYCSVRLMAFNSTWPGVHRHEAQAWKIGLWLMTAFVGIGDRTGEVFWPFVAILFMALRPAVDLTREGVARRRAFLDAVERGTPIP